MPYNNTDALKELIAVSTLDYWSLWRLEGLREVLYELSKPTANPAVRLIPCQKPLEGIVLPGYKAKVDAGATQVLVKIGLILLVSFELLEGARTGKKSADYARAFYPRIAITQRLINDYHAGRR